MRLAEYLKTRPGDRISQYVTDIFYGGCMASDVSDVKKKAFMALTVYEHDPANIDDANKGLITQEFRITDFLGLPTDVSRDMKSYGEAIFKQVQLEGIIACSAPEMFPDSDGDLTFSWYLYR